MLSLLSSSRMRLGFFCLVCRHEDLLALFCVWVHLAEPLPLSSSKID